MHKRSVLTMNQFTKEDIIKILDDAILFSNSFKDWQLSSNRLIANLFFEPSTRTHYSFLSAEQQLGCRIAEFNESSSSILKGETLYDTVKAFESIGYEAVVIRHPLNFYYKELENIKIPILNGGDGSGNHPSQSLLDLLTIYKEFGKFEDVNLLIVGDISHSRVAHSDIDAFQCLGGNVKISGPKELIDNESLYIDLDEGIKWADVVMMLRIQFERHEDTLKIDKEDYLEKYGLSKERAKLMKENAIIMHPAPVNRGVEIDDDLVECEKSRIFEQMSNGVLVRKALLKYIFEEEF